MKNILRITLIVVLMLAFATSSLALTSVPVKSIKPVTSDISLKAGNTYALKIAFTPDNATNKNVSYYTGDKNIATIDSKGVIKGIKAGKTVITVTSLSNKKAVAKCNVTVTAGVDPKYDPFGKYDKTITMTMGRDTVIAPNLPNGDTVEKNKILTAIKKRLNIDIKYEWLADSTNEDAYAQKVNLAIASGDLPDVMLIRKQSQLNQLVAEDMVEDLTPVFEKTLSPFLKTYYDTYGDSKYTLYNNKLYAIPNLNIGYQHGLLWVRKDWMDKVGATAPKTIDDVINLAKLFINKDPGGNGPGNTVGLTADPTVAGVYNGVNQLDPIFAVYKSYPRSWVKDAKGSYSYGTIAPETKAALETVAKMYKDGLIDKEFAVRKQVDENALIASGKAGMTFGPWWAPYANMIDSVKNNINADWIPLQAPLDKDGKFNAPVQNAHTQWLVVKKGYKYPEAVVKVLNLDYQGIRNLDKSLVDETYNTTPVVDWHVWPMDIQLDFNDAVVRYNKIVRDGVAAKGTDNVTFKGVVDNVLKNMQKKDPALWPDQAAWYVGSGAVNTPNTQFAKFGFPGQTKTMEMKWANLEKLENESILKIILGQAPISSFDSFVSQWKKLGGDEITQEVNQILK